MCNIFSPPLLFFELWKQIKNLFPCSFRFSASLDLSPSEKLLYGDRRQTRQTDPFLYIFLGEATIFPLSVSFFPKSSSRSLPSSFFSATPN